MNSSPLGTGLRFFPAITDSTASKIRRPWPARSRAAGSGPQLPFRSIRCRRANPVISLPIFTGSLHLASQVDHNPPTGEFFLRRSGAKRQTSVGASQRPESAFQILMTGTIPQLHTAAYGIGHEGRRPRLSEYAYAGPTSGHSVDIRGSLLNLTSRRFCCNPFACRQNGMFKEAGAALSMPAFRTASQCADPSRAFLRAYGR